MLESPTTLIMKNNLLGPKEIPPEGTWSSNDSPSKSFSNELPPWAGVACCDPPALGLGSGSKSIKDNSLFAFLDTPVVVPSVPFGIRAAPSTSPFLTNLYRSIVRWMLSLISNNLRTASASSDSSSHIFWIFGWALMSAFASSYTCQYLSYNLYRVPVVPRIHHPPQWDPQACDSPTFPPEFWPFAEPWQPLRLPWPGNLSCADCHILP